MQIREAVSARKGVGEIDHPIYPPNPFDGQTDHDIPPGKYPAVCNNIRIVENFEHKKWKSKELEESDFISFLFTLSLPGDIHKFVATRMMKCSLYEKSRLFAFLRDWLGQPPPEEFDPSFYKAQAATITVDSVPGTKNPDIRFCNIVSIAPAV